ncbi:MAG: hypothetical protein U0Q14_02800 [Dermatophilaceae bacterium]
MTGARSAGMVTPPSPAAGVPQGVCEIGPPSSVFVHDLAGSR